MHRHLLVTTLAVILAGTASAAETTTVSLDVQGMHCAACPLTVRQVLKKQPGVTDVKVDFKTHIAVITFDPTRATADNFAQASASAGFPATVLK